MTVSVALKTILVVVEAVEKRRILRGKWKAATREETAGFYNRALFLWLNPLFWKGYSKSLEVKELYELDKHLRSDYLHPRVKTAWERIGTKGRHSLLMLFFRRFKWYFLCAVPPRLAYIGFLFCQPFLINRAVDLSAQPIDEASKNVGYGLIGAYFVVYVGIAITMAQYQHWSYRSITMARGGLISMLFAKMSLLKSDDVDPAASMTLMSADIERITVGWAHMHEMWANCIEIVIAIYLLARQLGAACAIPLAVAVGKSPLAALTANNTFESNPMYSIAARFGAHLEDHNAKSGALARSD